MENRGQRQKSSSAAESTSKGVEGIVLSNLAKTAYSDMAFDSRKASLEHKSVNKIN